ncbi:MAG: Transcriptional regulator [Anaerospora sp.]|nr:Transcriptional regulator [Anaerospora sp.]
MKQLSDLFWNASVAELQQGYIYCEHSQEYMCLICGHKSIKGIIYADEATYYEAEKYIQLHIYREQSPLYVKRKRKAGKSIFSHYGNGNCQTCAAVFLYHHS